MSKLVNMSDDIHAFVKKCQVEGESLQDTLRRLLGLPKPVRAAVVRDSTRPRGRPSIYHLDILEVGEETVFPWHEGAGVPGCGAHPVFRAIRYAETKGKKFRGEPLPRGVRVTRLK